MEQAAARVAGIADAPDPTADPSRDVEPGTSFRLHHNPSRVSLPLSHQRSFSISHGHDPSSTGRPASTRDGRVPSTTGGRPSTQYDEDDLQGEVLWGPAHACYPHMNPHVPIDSPLYQSTRIIRVRRDWLVAGDLAPAFSNIYPEILDPLVTEEQFRALITHLNTVLVSTFSPWNRRHWLDAFMGLITGWLWDDLGLTSTKRELQRLDAWLEAWNRDVGQAEGVKVIPLKRTAYLNLDIQIPDPQLAVDFDDMRSRATTSRPPSSYSARTSGSMRRQRAGEDEYESYPVVPPIPREYLEEAQQRQAEQGRQEQQLDVHNSAEGE